MYVAQRLPSNNGLSGWVSMLPQREPNPPLLGSATADIAIIGGGFAGLAAARRLLQLDPQLHIALLEAQAIGEGATGRNSGFIIDLPHEVSSESYTAGSGAAASNPDIVLNRTAIALAKDIALERGWGKDIFDPCGKYNIAMGKQGDAHITSYAQQLDALKEPYELLNAEQIAAVTGSRAFTSALFTPGTVIIQPAAFIRGAADSLARAVRIFEKTPALSIEKQAGGWNIRTPNGSLSAGKVILANNGHAQSFGLFPGRLLHVFTYASMTEEFAPQWLGGQRSWAATPAFPMGTTVRRVAGRLGDRILIRSRYTYNPDVQASSGDIHSAGRVHDRKFLARFPMLAGLRMQYRWAGAMALTWNGVPAFGEVEPGLFAACACNGVGATKATALGMAAAEAALDADTELLRIVRNAAAPKRLPPQPFLTMGVKATLRLRELRAGVE